MAFVTAAFLSACATAMVVPERFGGDSSAPKVPEEQWQVYPAVRLDAFLVRIFAHGVATGHDGHTQQGPAFQYLVAPLAVVGLCIDMVISSVTDTLFLPYDLYRMRTEEAGN